MRLGARVVLVAVLSGHGASVVATSPIQVPDLTEALVPGGTSDRELRAGETHTYTVALNAGEFLHAVVVPRGIDVAANVATPDGQAFTVDLSPDDVVPEAVLMIAATTGHHVIKVRPARENLQPGRYVARVEAIRAATRADAIRVQAMRSLESGVQLRESLQDNAWQRAEVPLAAAVAGFGEAGDPAGEARALWEAATNGRFLSRPEVRSQAQQALEIYRKLGDRVGIARAIYLLGLIHDQYREAAQAHDAFSEALALSRTIGSRYLEAFTLNAKAIVYDKTGESERAIALYREALRVARAAAIPRVDRLALNNLGIAARILGDYRLSAKYLTEALALARAHGDRRAEAIALINLGNVYRNLRDYERALTVNREALALTRQVGDTQNEATAVNTLGSTLYRLRQYEEALEAHQHSLVLRRQLDDVAGQAAALDGAGLVWQRLGEIDRAFDAFTEALRLRRAVADRYREPDTLLHLATLERDRGNLAEALAHSEAAVRLTDSLRGQVVNPDLRATFVAAEQEAYEVYIETLMQLDRAQPGRGFAERALAASEAGRARVLLESLVEARTDIRQGIDVSLLDQERTYRRRLSEASARLSALLSREARSEAVAAARAAVETLGLEYRSLQVRIRQESPTYAALTQPRSLTVSEIRDQLLDPDTLLLEYALGERRSWLWAVTAADFVTFELPPRAEIEAIARQAYRLLTARQPRPDEMAAARMARVAQADADWPRQSRVLAAVLLREVANHLGAAWRGKRLLVVAPDVLQYIPFAALPDPTATQQPVIFDHEVVNLPSASVLALVREQTDRRPVPAKTLAVLADPVFEVGDPRVRRGGSRSNAREEGTRRAQASEDEVTYTARAMRSAEAVDSTAIQRLSRLPFSRQEARAITGLVPADRRFEAVDFEASRATVINGALDEYGFVHFATHGFLNSEQPELSGLVLSLVDRDGRSRDGFLRLNDIYNLRLPAELVVLSACQTALGREVRGEGLLGLTRGFMYAGARRVVASLWQVDDLATSELMRVLYRNMLQNGLRPAAALRAAQRDLARQPRWSAPFFWSGFVLQGEWR